METIENLKAEIERLQAERDLAVKVAVMCMDETLYHADYSPVDALVWDNETITYGDIRTVKQWAGRWTPQATK